jgi:F-type H+-transporting ATPase subunit delta
MQLVEKRYAQALINTALQYNVLDIYEKQLSSFIEVLKNSLDLENVLWNPTVKIQDKIDIALKVIPNDFDEKLTNFIKLLIEKNRIEYAEGILQEYIIMKNKIKSQLDIKIITAVPIENEQIEKIKEKYKSKYGTQSVNAKIEINQSILGGIAVKVGDTLYDRTIKTQFEEMFKHIEGNNL